MIDRLFEQVELLIAARGGGKAELHLHRVRARRFDSRDGGIDSTSFSDTTAIGLRVFRDGRMGFSYAFRAGEEDIRRLVEAAIYCAAASEPDPAHDLPDLAGAAPTLPLYEPAWEGIDDAARADFACTLERETLNADSRLKRVRTAALSETVSDLSFRNSAGSFGNSKQSIYSAFSEAVAEEGSEGQTGYGFAFARSFSCLSAAAVGREAGNRALRMLGAGRIASGRYPAVLENGAAAELLEVLMPSFLSSQAAKGKSMLAGKVGERIAPGVVGVDDDPLDPGGSASAPFDGEGVPSRTVPLLEGGILRDFLSDTFWARKTGGTTTGSCRRAGAKVPPAPGISNLRLAPGNRTLAQLCLEAGSGILVTEFLGIHTADPVSGDFSVGASGFRIEGGEPTVPLRGFAVSGNVLSLLSGVTAVGSDFRWFGNIGAPSVAVESIDVGGE